MRRRFLPPEQRLYKRRGIGMRDLVIFGATGRYFGIALDSGQGLSQRGKPVTAMEKARAETAIGTKADWRQWRFSVAIPMRNT
jgi:hypothetical protein